MSSKKLDIAIAATVVITLIFITEVVSGLLIVKNNRFFESSDRLVNAYRSIPNLELGWELSKNDSYRASIVKQGGQVVYDVEYKIDEYGRRSVGQNIDNALKHLILLGDSLVFGTGLDDNNTLQYQIANYNKEFAVYNYAVHGYGPHQIYKRFISENLSDQIKQKNGIAIYFINLSYLPRVIGSSSTIWNMYSPVYKLNHLNRLYSLGSFKTVSPIKTELLKLYSKLKYNSNFLTLINLDFPVSFSDSDILLVSSLIQQTAAHYHKLFNGKFYVVVHPLYDSKDLQKVKNNLLNDDIQVLTYDIKPEESFYLENDGHPSAKFNHFFAPILMESLEK